MILVLEWFSGEIVFGTGRSFTLKIIFPVVDSSYCILLIHNTLLHFQLKMLFLTFIDLLSPSILFLIPITNFSLRESMVSLLLSFKN